jgi:hypothetical protein
VKLTKLTGRWSWLSIWLMSSIKTTHSVLLAVAVALFTLGLIGCSKPFNVKARVDGPAESLPARGSSGGVEIQAAAVLDEDYLYATFDANLLMANILPVRIIIENKAKEPLPLRKAEFELVAEGAAAGRSFRELPARKVFKRLISYYNIKAYSKFGFKQSLEDFSSYALDRSSALGQDQAARGILFFQIPPDILRAPGLTLVVKRLTVSGDEPKKGIVLKL